MTSPPAAFHLLHMPNSVATLCHYMFTSAGTLLCTALNNIVPQRNSMKHRSSISSVHDDVLQEGLLDHLEAQDLCRLAQVSRRFHSLAVRRILASGLPNPSTRNSTRISPRIATAHP